MAIDPSDQTLIASAKQILRDNDRGAYTIPSQGLYPFQWNWDSCLTALGQREAIAFGDGVTLPVLPPWR
jgi:hypothetical protein